MHSSLDPGVEPVSRYHSARTKDGSGCIPYSPIQGGEHVTLKVASYVKIKLRFRSVVRCLFLQYSTAGPCIRVV